MNSFKNNSMRWRYLKQSLFFGTVRLSALIIVLALGGILFYIIVNGIGAISWDFITKPPTDSMTKGGIMPAILGTIYLTIGAIAVGLPFRHCVSNLPDRICYRK